jgi:hypothetical protein
MDLSKAVACIALLLIVLLCAGHAVAQTSPKKPVRAKSGCMIKPVMSEAELAACRRPGAEQKRPARRSGTTARSAG